MHIITFTKKTTAKSQAIGAAIGYGGEFDILPAKAFRTGCLSLDGPDRPPLAWRGSIRVLLLAPSLASSRHDTPSASGFGGFQAEADSPGCHCQSSLPITLRRQFATSLSWLHERHSQ